MDDDSILLEAEKIGATIILEVAIVRPEPEILGLSAGDDIGHTEVFGG